MDAQQPIRKLHSLERTVALFAVLAVLFLSVGFAQGAEPVALRSSAVLVVDARSGEPLVEKNADAVVPIASITKLMTAIVVLDRGLDLEQRIVVSSDDIDTIKGTRSRLRAGTVLTRSELMLLALMSSENRAASALGRTYPGGTEALVRAMNFKAGKLGMRDTRFVEPTGLSSENVSSARDLVRLVSAADRYDVIRDFSTRSAAEVDALGRRVAYRNTNGLVRNPDWDIAVSKTGYLSEAGRCLVMRARFASRDVIFVLLDSIGRNSRIGDANRIRKWLESSVRTGISG